MKHFINLSIFLVIAIIAWWTITEDYNKDDQIQQAKSKRYVEVFMNEFEIMAMDENGKPGYILNGVYLEKYNNSDNTLVQQPELHLTQKNGQWKISADEAIINNKKETLMLKNNVVMQQQNIEPALTIRTQRLVINTKTQIAKTKAAVKITQGKSQMNSNGMIYNNITSALELSSKVNGSYLPNN